MRSLALIFAILISSLMFHFGFRMYGFSVHYAEKRSEVFSSSTEIIHLSFQKEEYKNKLDRLSQLCLEKDCYVDLSTYFSKDEKLFIYEDGSNRYQHLGNQEIKTSDEIKKDVADLLSLEDLLNKFPNVRGVLHVNANRPGIIKSLIPILAKNKSYQRFVICSEFGNIVRSVRDEKPHWNTCASMDELTKAHMMSSIYLESVSPLPSEYYYIGPKMLKRLSENLLHEIKRRNLFLISPEGSAVEASIKIKGL